MREVSNSMSKENDPHFIVTTPVCKVCRNLLDNGKCKAYGERPKEYKWADKYDCPKRDIDTSKKDYTLLELNINNIRVIQAPLAGISDIIFRGQIRKYSASCLMTTEMISSEMLCNNPNPRIIQFEDFGLTCFEVHFPRSFLRKNYWCSKKDTDKQSQNCI